MKGREVREKLIGKAEPVVVHVLAEMAETASAQQEEIQALAVSMNKLTDILLQLGATIESATNTVDEIQKMRNG
tara:strand:- start:130 stop:351 length:222 start_codon:yes stop_codon:yes gene_type:complete